MVQTIKTMIRPSRPNWPLIRPNPDHSPDYKDYDQTFQAELTSDQTEPRPWSRLKRLWSDFPDRIDFWSDRTQTMVQTIKTMIRPSRPNWPLIRPNPDHGPDYKDYDQTFQTELTSDQTEPRPWSRLKRLWSDFRARIDFWSDRTQTMVQTKKTMIRPSRPNWQSDQTKIRPWSRLLSARTAFQTLLCRSGNTGVCARLGLIIAQFGSGPKPGL